MRKRINNLKQIIYPVILSTGLLTSSISIPLSISQPATEQKNTNLNINKNSIKNNLIEEEILTKIFGGWNQEDFGKYLLFLNSAQATINGESGLGSNWKQEINNANFLNSLFEIKLSLGDTAGRQQFLRSFADGYVWDFYTELNDEGTQIMGWISTIKGAEKANYKYGGFSLDCFYQDTAGNYPTWNIPSESKTTFSASNPLTFKTIPALKSLSFPNLLFGETSPFNINDEKWFWVDNNKIYYDYRVLGINILETINSKFFNEMISNEINKGSNFRVESKFEFTNPSGKTMNELLKKYNLTTQSNINELIKVLGNSEFSGLKINTIFEIEFLNGGTRKFYNQVNDFESFNLIKGNSKQNNQLDNLSLWFSPEEIKAIRQETNNLQVASYKYYDAKTLGTTALNLLTRLVDNVKDGIFTFKDGWVNNELTKNVLQRNFQPTSEEIYTDNWKTSLSWSDEVLANYSVTNFQDNVIDEIKSQYGFLNEESIVNFWDMWWGGIENSLKDFKYWIVTKNEVDGRESYDVVENISELPDDVDLPDEELKKIEEERKRLITIIKSITFNENLEMESVKISGFLKSFQIYKPLYRGNDKYLKMDFKMLVDRKIIWENAFNLNESKFVEAMKSDYLSSNIEEDENTFILLRDKLLINVSAIQDGIYGKRYLIFDNLRASGEWPTLYDYMVQRNGRTVLKETPSWVGIVIGGGISGLFSLALLFVVIYGARRKKAKDLVDTKIINEIK